MHRRFFVVFVSLFAFCLSFPCVAYAAYSPTVVWSGYYDDGDSFGSVVKAGGTFDAAAVSLGYDPARISANDKSKLADPDYGGRFYLYSQTFVRVNTPLDFPDWVPGYIVMGSTISSAWDSLTNQFVRLWVSGVSASLYDGALSDLKAVLAGEDLGGGSVVTGYTEYDMMCCDFYNPDANQNVVNDSYSNALSASIDSSGNVTVGSSVVKYSVYTNSVYYASSARCYVSPSVQSFINDVVSDGKKVVVNVGIISHSDINYAQIYVADDFNIVYESVKGQSRYIFYMTNGYYWSVTNNRSTYYDSEGVFFVFPDVTPSLTPIQSYGAPMYYASPIISPSYNPPAGDWPEPETPATPTAPELPDPVTPTVTPEPTVTEPAPTWPVIPTPTAPTVTLTDTPSGLDYTQLLTLINDNLNDINSYTVAINSNFNSLRSDLVTEFDSVVQALRNIYQYLQHMDNVLERHCVHLQNKMEDVSVDIQNKMRELVHWLADQIDFDSSEDGDDELSDLLSTINDKLGGGTYEPNPISNEDGYYQWLDDLWDRFLLGDDWESSVSGISSSFGQLKTRFPFSVPWDIVALFRLFVHDPVTPEFDLPLYFSPDSSTPVHVDLSAWDDVASIVRPLVYVIFALKLALLSRDLLGGLGADKGGL